VISGTCLLFCSFYNEDWLMNVHNLNVIPLSIAWLIINFLAATQDIVVDGWACSMLQKSVSICFVMNIIINILINTFVQTFVEMLDMTKNQNIVHRFRVYVELAFV